MSHDLPALQWRQRRDDAPGLALVQSLRSLDRGAQMTSPRDREIVPGNSAPDAAWSVPCPVCKVRAGFSCLRNGKQAPGVHRARIDLFEDFGPIGDWAGDGHPRTGRVEEDRRGAQAQGAPAPNSDLIDTKWRHPRYRGLWSVSKVGKRYVYLSSPSPLLQDIRVDVVMWPGSWEPANPLSLDSSSAAAARHTLR